MCDDLIERTRLTAKILRWMEAAALAAIVEEAADALEEMRAEVEKLRTIAWCAYQMAGVHDAPLVWLDRLSEAANGVALPDTDTLMDELLPYQLDAVCEAEARTERLEEALMEYGLPLTGDDIQDALEFGDEAVAREKRRRAALAQENRND